MKKIWVKKTEEEIRETVFTALEKNINYQKENILGVPASYLDEKVFPQEAPFLKEAPFLSALIQNPNHIGCHTLGKSESFFNGTQALEKELIEICAADILAGKLYEQDGYVTSGGTEANMQAIWIYRNYFQKEYKAKREEICIICSSDNHYSMDKAANVFSIDIDKVKVTNDSRELTPKQVEKTLKRQIKKGKKYFIIIANMMTTMFGSVDDLDIYVDALEQKKCVYRIHVDGAYGGFYYPFSEEKSQLTFANPKITSFTLDAHKMAQAPYGTGIFLIRKGFIHYANTKEASYVEGEDYTLIGSRSGANAISVWMILVKNGPFGWQEKIFVLQKRTNWFCQQLTELGVKFYRHQKANIVTIRKEYLSEKIAKKFGLVPDNHSKPSWYKVVIMDHVIIEKLIPLIEAIKKTVHAKK